MIKIKLSEQTKEIIQVKHYRDIKDKFKLEIEKMIKLPEYEKLKHYLCDSSGEINDKKLKKLLIGTKDDLSEIIKIIGEIRLSKNDPFEKLYTNFTKRNWSKLLLEKLNIRVCPYCNRQYTFFISNAGVRPQFDHFFPKSIFSYLSVSLYNLVPSCSLCNSKKHALDTSKAINDFYYPYEDEFGRDVVFQTHSNTNDFLYWIGMSNNFDIEIVCKDEKLLCKVENLKNHLKIELLYKQHKDYVRDLIRNAVIYNESRVDELIEQFPDLFRSRKEVINSVFLNNIDIENWGDRPLSKLTHDIYKEFKMF